MFPQTRKENLTPVTLCPYLPFPLSCHCFFTSPSFVKNGGGVWRRLSLQNAAVSSRAMSWLQSCWRTTDACRPQSLGRELQSGGGLKRGIWETSTALRTSTDCWTLWVDSQAEDLTELHEHLHTRIKITLRTATGENCECTASLLALNENECFPSFFPAALCCSHAVTFSAAAVFYKQNSGAHLSVLPLRMPEYRVGSQG